MSIGEDIKQAYIDIGAAYTILRPGGDIEGEYGRFGNFSSGFNGHGAEAELPFDTLAVPGDLLRVGSSGNVYLIVASNGETIENEIIRVKADLIRINVQFSHFHLIANSRKPDMTPDATWSLLGSDRPGCFMRSISPVKEYMGRVSAGSVGVNEAAMMIVPDVYGVNTGHRLVVGSMTYMIQEMENTNYTGVAVCALVEDTR